MDLRAYYRHVRDAEATLTGEHQVMISMATPEGGVAGVRTEAPRAIAAKLIAEGRARVATDEEAAEFNKGNKDARLRHEREESAKRIQVMVIPSAELKEEQSKKQDRS
jgi:hypothetical protein